MIDFLSDENGDIAVRGGDLATGEAQTVVVEQLVVASGGEFKFSPVLGVGTVRAIGSNGNIDNIKVKLIEDMKRCNIDYKSIEIINKIIEVRL
jgi:hypothetical protein